ncbi:MAG: hypothetical protein EXS13_08060 [Planctomycetes bacterium]|nr:hypothetical protein [Planctomycetota bacterium]
MHRSFPLIYTLLATWSVAAGSTRAQHALVFVPEGDCTTRGGLTPLDLLTDETLCESTPGASPISADKVLSLAS